MSTFTSKKGVTFCARCCGIILQQRVFFLFCTRAGRWAPGWLPTSYGPGRLSHFFWAVVCARKPNSLALRVGEREPCGRHGLLFHFFRAGVRAWKPKSLALRGGERELCGRHGRLSHFFRGGVRAWKPNSLTLRVGEREPGAGKNEKVRLCIRNRIILSCCRTMHLICLEL